MTLKRTACRSGGTPKLRTWTTGREAEADALSKKLAEVFSARTNANRAVKDQTARVLPDDAFQAAPAEPVEVAALNRQLMDNASKAAKLYDLKRQQEGIVSSVDRFLKEIEAAQAAILRLQNEAAELQTLVEDLEPEVLAPEQVDEITATIEDATRLNKLYEDFRRNEENKAVLEQLKKEAEKANTEVEEARQALLTLMKESDLPGGIEMTEEGVTLDGLPFDSEQISSSRRIIAGLEIAEKMIGEKSLRFLRLDATLLDEASEKAVLDWAESKDLQLALEVVDRTGGEIRVKIIED